MAHGEKEGIFVPVVGKQTTELVAGSPALRVEVGDPSAPVGNTCPTALPCSKVS